VLLVQVVDVHNKGTLVLDDCKVSCTVGGLLGCHAECGRQQARQSDHSAAAHAHHTAAQPRPNLSAVLKSHTLGYIT
jgi:hypothetical protein